MDVTKCVYSITAHSKVRLWFRSRRNKQWLTEILNSIYKFKSRAAFSKWGTCNHWSPIPHSKNTSLELSFLLYFKIANNWESYKWLLSTGRVQLHELVPEYAKKPRITQNSSTKGTLQQIWRSKKCKLIKPTSWEYKSKIVLQHTPVI